tara:strand:+ start:223 stop:480 length:258 start_codon:yes stop_codon:yes gene_type:complete
MKRKKIIENILLNSFSFLAFKVEDISILHQGHNNFNGKNETHFKITLHSKKIDSSSRLSLHRKINELLKEEFSTGLHALEIKFKY